MAVLMVCRIRYVILLLSVCFVLQNITAQSNGRIRLHDGQTNLEGRLEIYYRRHGYYSGYEWGTICNTGFGEPDGIVACRQLGYLFSSNRTVSNANQGTRKIWLKDIACTGTETRLTDCGHSRWDITSYCSHSQDVYLTCMEDTEAPEISGCPDDIVAKTELGTSGTIVSWIEPTATDQMEVSETILSHPRRTMFDIGNTGVAYIFRDPSRNTAICTFSVIVETVDTVRPEVIGCPNNINTTLELGTANETSVNWDEPSATDLSGLPQRSRSRVPSTEFSIGATLVEYMFVDTSNNTAECTFSVTVGTVDTTAPVISQCPTDFEYISGRHVTWTEPTSYDVSGNVTGFQSHWPGMFLAATTSVVYSFTDPSGNVAYCNFTIIVAYDTMPPSIHGCPADVFSTAEIDQSETPVYWTEPYATDDNGRVILIETSHTSGARFPVGYTSVLYTFADDSYNKAYCNFSVIIEQVNTPADPTLSSCPSDITKNIHHGSMNTHVYWKTPRAAAAHSGNVSLIRQSHFPGDSFGIGKTTVKYVFLDDNGREEICAFVITVREVDTLGPTIRNCPPDIMAPNGDDEPVRTWIEPSAIDSSGNVTLLTKTHSPGDRFGAGSTNVIYFFQDSSYNMAICSFDIIINSIDTVGPTISNCPPDIVAPNGEDEPIRTWIEPFAIDSSGNVTLLTKTHSPGDRFGAGSTNVIYFFQDSSYNIPDNIAICSFDIIINSIDTVGPTISNCPPEIMAPNGEDEPVRTWIEPSAIDSSGNVTLLAKTHSPGDRFAVGSTNVMYFFQDSSHNMAICNFDIHINSSQNYTHLQVDTTAPHVLYCPSDINESVELGSSDVAVISWVKPSALDLHKAVTLVYASHEPGDVFLVGITTNVSYVFADNSDNIATCYFTVTVTQVDTREPDILFCPDMITETIEVGSLQKRVYWSAPRASDLSGNVSLASQSNLSGHYFMEGTSEVKYIFVDDSGNAASCLFFVILKSVDTRAPEILNCPSDVNTAIEVGSVGSHVTWMEPTAIDVSDNVTLLIKTHSPGDLFKVGDTNVIYLFTDSSNNIAGCNFVITTSMIDSTAPSIMNCPGHINASMEIGTTGVEVSWNEPFAIDQSGTFTSTSSHEPGQTFLMGSTNVVYYFEDQSHNRAECNFTVNVELVDTTPPAIQFCPEPITDTIELGIMDKTMSWSEPIASDISGNVSMESQSHFSGDVFMFGQTEVKYIFVDRTGNEAVCTFYVTLMYVDTSPPNIMNCPSDIRSSVEVGTFEIPVFWNEPSAFDVSGIANLQTTHISGSGFSVGITKVSYQFTDNSRNSAFCNFTVIIDQVDTVSPNIIDCPSDMHETVEIGLSEISVSWNDVSAYDKSGDVTLDHYTHQSGDLFSVGSTKVSYIFTDGFNNSAICDFLVTVTQIDTVAPTITYCPDDIETDVDLGSFGSIVNWDEPKAEDASGVAILLLQTHMSGTFFTAGTTFVTYIFRDKANNMERCSFTVTVTAVDTSTPRVSNCPSSIQVATDAGKTEATVSWVEPFVMNLPSATNISSTRRPNDSFEIGSTPVVYIFEDDTGHQLFCNFTVIVTETVGNLSDSEHSNIKSNTDESTGDKEGHTGVSLAGLVLSLMIVLIILICGSIVLIIYIRKRRNSSAIELESLSTSTTMTSCSQKTASKV